MSNVESYIDGILEEKGGGSGEGTATTVTDLKPGDGEEVTILGKTTLVTDELNNTIYVPGDFGIAKDSGTKVEEGIVIEDANGNQFVWILVGEYKVSTTINAEGKLTNNLSRRTFTDEEATEVDGDTEIGSGYYGEGATQDEDGEPITPVTTNIEAFKTSATTKGGFYIGRYEAGTEEERTSKSDPLTTPLVQANKNAYVYVTRDQAKEKSEELYRENSFVTSELISSYAWDTALNYICQTSKEYGYSLATTTSSERANIGTRNKELTGAYTADKYSNICDVLGNVYEWTTEYSTFYSGGPCVPRGGYYYYSVDYAAYRYYGFTTSSSDNIGFRTQLYIK